ncbi:MAG: CvpA family protein, partial [Betaproteobacteria bacterium]
MTAFDYVVLGIFGLSIIVSVWRGAVREILALAAWVIAFLAAQGYASSLAAYLPAALSNPALRLFAGFVIAFMLAFLVS